MSGPSWKRMNVSHSPARKCPVTDDNPKGIDLFVILIKKLLSPERESVAHGAEGYYFATNGTIQLKEMALAAARFLSGQENPEHRPYTQEEMDKVFPFAVCSPTFLSLGVTDSDVVAPPRTHWIERCSYIDKEPVTWMEARPGC